MGLSDRHKSVKFFSQPLPDAKEDVIQINGYNAIDTIRILELILKIRTKAPS